MFHYEFWAVFDCSACDAGWRSTVQLVRASAARYLGDLGARRAVPALLRNLNANNDLVRSASVAALGKLGDPSVFPELREIAVGDEAASIRMTAMNSLALLNDAQGRAMTCVRLSHE